MKPGRLGRLSSPAPCSAPDAGRGAAAARLSVGIERRRLALRRDHVGAALGVLLHGGVRVRRRRFPASTRCRPAPRCPGLESRRRPPLAALLLLAVVAVVSVGRGGGGRGRRSLRGDGLGVVVALLADQHSEQEHHAEQRDREDREGRSPLRVRGELRVATAPFAAGARRRSGASRSPPGSRRAASRSSGNSADRWRARTRTARRYRPPAPPRAARRSLRPLVPGCACH